MGSFPSFPAERTSLFHPRLTGFLFSSPPSNVRPLKSAANQSFMVFWGQFDIHALLFSLLQLQGDCPKKRRKKNGQVLQLSLEEYGLWQCNGKEDIWQLHTIAQGFLSSTDSEKARWVTGHEKRLLRNSCFLWAGPSHVCLPFSQMKFLCSVNRILSHLDWFTFIAFIAQIRGKW